jgi:hypothetical protein
MLKIADLFKKIQNRQSKELFLRSVIKDTIYKHTQISVPVESIIIKSDTLSINDLSQTAKSQIFIKREAIIKDINMAQTIRTISNII